MGFLGIFAVVFLLYQLIKEACEPTIPKENFANKDLLERDKRSGISDKQLWKNIKNGKYVLNETYSPPPRNEYGHVIIQNNILYEQDCKKYGWIEAKFLAKKGKYNLSQEELEAEKHREKKKYKEIYLIK